MTKSFQPSELFRGNIRELNALRAIGAMVVILDHAWPHGGPHHRIWDFLNLSWVLMDCFFVLSGFLIAGILLDTREHTDYYRSFYTRRAMRILPVYYLLIAVLTWVAIHFETGSLYPGTQGLHSWGSPWWFFVYLGNLPPAITGRFPSAVSGSYMPLWSLQIEEQFYLLFPLFIRRLKLKTLIWSLLGLCCFSTVLRIALYFHDPSNTLIQYVLLPCRMEGLALGACIAARFRMGPWNFSRNKLALMTSGWVAAALTCGAFDGFIHNHSFNRTIGLLISPIACAHVVLLFISLRDSRLTSFLRIRPLQYIGKISYGAYLFHMPVAAAVDTFSPAVGLQFLDGGYLRPLSILTMTLFVSMLSWEFFESPLLRLKNLSYFSSFLTAKEPVVAAANSRQ